MRLMLIILLFSLSYAVTAKNNARQATESSGQEVIEIGSPIKELPMGLEEEPSGEEDNDDEESTSLKTGGNTAVATKKDVQKATTISVKKNVKEMEKIEDEDEARIEKELSEIYKDTADYKSDSAEEKEVAKNWKTPAPVRKMAEDDISAEETDADKPIGRQQQKNFKLAPDSTDRASIERFRTSRDEIVCNEKQKLNAESTTPYMVDSPDKIKLASDDAFRMICNGFLLITSVLSYVFICS